MPVSATSPDPPTTLPPAQVAKLHAAAQDFEAMALGQLLKPMFDTVDTAHSAFGGGEAESTIKPLLIDALAKHIAAHGGLGLAAPVFASMLRTQEALNASHSDAASSRPEMRSSHPRKPTMQGTKQ